MKIVIHILFILAIALALINCWIASATIFGIGVLTYLMERRRK